MVSEADRNVEVFIRERLTLHFPKDGIVGEEYTAKPGTSGYVWVIDPIDGTANFIRGIPAWTVVLACVYEDKTIIGCIYDPVHDELFSCRVGAGAFCNDKPIKIATTDGFHDGSIGVGFSNRSKPEFIETMIKSIISKGGVFYRNASGALSLAYVACGKLNGYAEDHMNAWDYLAGQLLVAEAGGTIEHQSADEAIAKGGRVIVATPSLFEDLRRMATIAMK